MLKINEKNKKRLKIFGQIISYLVIGLLLIVAIFTVTTVFDIPGGYKMYVVQSGSMEPAVKKGSIVLVQKQNSYQKDDIVTFTTSSKETVTHRIYELNEDRLTYVTKGDANNAPDTTELLATNIVGKVQYAISYLGYPVGFAKTLPGLIILIIIPAVVIVYSEILAVIQEINRMRGKMNSTTDKDAEIARLKSELEKLQGVKEKRVSDTRTHKKATEKKSNPSGQSKTTNKKTQTKKKTTNVKKAN